MAPILAPAASSSWGRVAAESGCERPPLSATCNGGRSAAPRFGLTGGAGGGGGPTAVLGGCVSAAAGGAHDGPRRATRLLFSLVTTLPPVSLHLRPDRRHAGAPLHTQALTGHLLRGRTQHDHHRASGDHDGGGAGARSPHRPAPRAPQQYEKASETSQSDHGRGHTSPEVSWHYPQSASTRRQGTRYPTMSPGAQTESKRHSHRRSTGSGSTDSAPCAHLNPRPGSAHYDNTLE